MADEETLPSKEVLGKIVASTSAKKFGEVGDIIFEVKSGELIQIVLKNPTKYADKLELEQDQQGNFLIIFSAVENISDFLLVSEAGII